eukprot:5288962-Pyramimonas_sp.AAC.1
MAKSLAEAKIKDEGAAATFKLACVEAMTAASGKYAKDGHQMLLWPGDASALSGDKKATIVLHADEFLQKVREIATQTKALRQTRSHTAPS